MRTVIVKWLAITALLLTMIFWDFAVKYQLPLNLLICSAAAVVLIQAFQAKRRRWVVGFVAVALLFNPAAPVFPLTGSLGFLLVMLATIAFASSLYALKAQPLLSIPSITDRNPGSHSL